MVFMRNKSETTKVVFITLFLLVFCLFPFLVVPLKDWYIILIIIGVPTLSILAFGLLSNQLGLSSDPKRLWTASYFVIAFISFCLSAIAFYLTNYSWSHILLYSAGFGVLVVVSAMTSVFVWSKIKNLSKDNPTSSE